MPATDLLSERVAVPRTKGVLVLDSARYFIESDIQRVGSVPCHTGADPGRATTLPALRRATVKYAGPISISKRQRGWRAASTTSWLTAASSAPARSCRKGVAGARGRAGGSMAGAAGAAAGRRAAGGLRAPGPWLRDSAGRHLPQAVHRHGGAAPVARLLRRPLAPAPAAPLLHRR